MAADTSSFDRAQDGNLFPREDLLEAVARSDWRDAPVPLAAWALLVLGVSALCLGLPIEDVLAPATTERAARLGSPPVYDAPLLHGVGVLGRSAGIGIEAAFFGYSALGAGLAIACIGLCLRAFGFRGRLALLVAILAGLAPAVAIGGRLPTLATMDVATTALLLAACSAPHDPGRRGAFGYGLRVAAAFLVGVLIAPGSPGLWLIVPLLAGVAHVADEVRPRYFWTVLALGLIASTFSTGRITAGPGASPFADDDRTAVGLALGAGVLLLAWPLSRVRDPEEAGAPAYLHASVAIPAALTLIGFGTLAAALPALAVFTANVLARRARPDGAMRWAGAFLAVQIGALVLAHAALPRTDVDLESLRPAPRPGDLVVVDEGQHFSDLGLLLRRRIGAEVVRASEFEDADVRGRRVLWAASAAPPAGADVTPLTAPGGLPR